MHSSSGHRIPGGDHTGALRLRWSLQNLLEEKPGILHVLGQENNSIQFA